MARLARRSSVSEDGGELLSSHRATARSARLRHSNNRASPSPSPSSSSDKENHESTLVSNRRSDGKLNAMAPKLSSSTSADAGTSHSSKKRRLGERNAPISQIAFRKELDEIDDTKYYDPDQPLEERQANRKGYRDSSKFLADSRGELLQAESKGLKEIVLDANKRFETVKQTSDAIFDSGILVNTADLAVKRANQMTFGNQTQGIDVTEFIGKCISFMRNGPSDSEAALTDTSTQRRRQARNEGDEDDSIAEEKADEGDAFNWEWLGRKACFPNNLRPPVPSFLLGPLSVQKKVRKQTQRRERLQKQDPRNAVRPEEIKSKDIERVENANLTILCTNIYHQLYNLMQQRHNEVEARFTDDLLDEDRIKLARESGLMDDWGLPLFEAVINPLSFGQSVENLFYISFLIRDGKMRISSDSRGLPSLTPVAPDEPSKDKEPKSDPKPSKSKHQAVFHLDFDIWEDIVTTFEIKKCIIPHRNSTEGTQISASGWYA